MPKRPQPGHPLADAARDEAAVIDTMVPPAAVVPPPPAPEIPPLPASDRQDDLPPVPPAPIPGNDQPDSDVPPLDPRYVQTIVQQNDTLLGRLEAESRGRREAEDAVKAALANREFTEKRLQELAEANRVSLEELARLHADRDVASAVTGFQSEHVDKDAFGDIYRGLHPHLKRFETTIQAQIDAAVEKRVKEVKADAEKSQLELRKELNERTIMQAVPTFGKLVDRPDFKDFLAETVPGTRTTRRAEVLSAWRDGDTRFIADVVEQFKLRGAPRAVDNEPVNHGRPAPDQNPRSPTPEPQIDEDQLAAYFQQYKEERITVAQYRKVKALYDKQQLERWRQSKRAN